jgi:hypothetical protein
MKTDEIGGTCSVHAIFIGKVQGKTPLENLSIYEKILESNLEKYVNAIFIRVMWPEIWSIGVFFNRNGLSIFLI